MDGLTAETGSLRVGLATAQNEVVRPRAALVDEQNQPARRAYAKAPPPSPDASHESQERKLSELESTLWQEEGLWAHCRSELRDAQNQLVEWQIWCDDNEGGERNQTEAAGDDYTELPIAQPPVEPPEGIG